MKTSYALWYFIFCSILLKIPGQYLLNYFEASLIEWNLQLENTGLEEKAKESE